MFSRFTRRTSSKLTCLTKNISLSSSYIPFFSHTKNTIYVPEYDPSNPPFEKLLIANRGEIAVRVINTCRKMGIKTVAVHSEADKDGKFVDMADEAICIGPAPSNQSYLQIERIVEACKMTGAQAVHPGFGFLSENNQFAKALEDNNIVFIGPRSYAIEVMGDKITSKECAINAGVNVIPGDNRVIKDETECVQVANQIGYPVMVKASAGGGGKGMRIANNDKECREAFRLSTNEAISSFGDGRLFVEKFVEEPRHVEIQVLADQHGNVVYLNERECSIQRRNQKVYEEAPSPCVSPELRSEMGRQACMLAKAVDYITAGTCEFLVDKNRDFYFLEMNTRLQVEHPITEMITGVDLVQQMINVAAGQKLPFKQNDIGINGWSLEARVYAEDPFKDFLPQTGSLFRYKEPLHIDNVRCDSGIRENSEISVHYDPMICKLITWGEDRLSALTTMRKALDSYVIQGLNHNVPFLRSVLDHPKFIEGDMTTKFIEEEYPEGFDKKYIKLENSDINRLIFSAAHCHIANRRDLTIFYDPDQGVDLYVTFENKVYPINVRFKGNNGNFTQIKLNDDEYNFSSSYSKHSSIFDTLVNEEDDVSILQLLERSSHDLTLQYRGVKYDFNVLTPDEYELWKYMPIPEVIDEESVLLAPMPGNIFSISVKPGDFVQEGQEVCIIEAMKMQNVFYAKRDGLVKAVYVKQGQAVQNEQKIYELEPLPEEEEA